MQFLVMVAAVSVARNGAGAGGGGETRWPSGRGPKSRRSASEHVAGRDDLRLAVNRGLQE